jgi:hypothetical protein
MDLNWRGGSLQECRLTAVRDGHWVLRSGRSSLPVSMKAGRSQTFELSDGTLSSS